MYRPEATTEQTCGSGATQSTAYIARRWLRAGDGEGALQGLGGGKLVNVSDQHHVLIPYLVLHRRPSAVPLGVLGHPRVADAGRARGPPGSSLR